MFHRDHSVRSLQSSEDTYNERFSLMLIFLIFFLGLQSKLCSEMETMKKTRRSRIHQNTYKYIFIPSHVHVVLLYIFKYEYCSGNR